MTKKLLKIAHAETPASTKPPKAVKVKVVKPATVIDTVALIEAAKTAAPPAPVKKVIAPGRGRKSRYNSPALLETLRILAPNFNLQDAAKFLVNHGVDFANAPSLRFTAVKHNFSFKGMRGPRAKVATETVVKHEVPAAVIPFESPVEKARVSKVDEPAMVLTCHKRGRRSLHIIGLIGELQKAGYAVK